MKKILKVILLINAMLAVFGAALPVYAQKLTLPACTESGNCQLNDMVALGAQFANLITGLAAALFLATFVYGGGMYILSFGDSGRVKKGKDAITGGAIGMGIVVIAWTLVTYIIGSLTGQYGGGATSAPTVAKDACTAQGEGWSCKTFEGAKTTSEATQKGTEQGFQCIPGKCPGAINILCCKIKTK